jgi:hypothetical protein
MSKFSKLDLPKGSTPHVTHFNSKPPVPKVSKKKKKKK